MVGTISSELARLNEAGSAAAATFQRVPTLPTTQPVRPDPDLVRGIGESAEADAFRGASPDLQTLLDALLANFGTESDLPDDEAESPEVTSEISDNNEGSRDAVEFISQRAEDGRETATLEGKIEEKRAGDQPVSHSEVSESESLVDESEGRLDATESDLDGAQRLSDRAREAASEAQAKALDDLLGGADKEKLQRSADLFDQKSAAAESAARLHKVMVEKVLAKAEDVLRENRRRRQEGEETAASEEPAVPAT